MKKIIIIIISLFVLVAMAGFTGYSLLQKAMLPLDKTDTEMMRYELEAGSTTHVVVADLVELQLIESEVMANMLIRLNDWGHIQAGTYELSRAMTLEEMFEKFSTGDVVEADVVKVVVPEGYTLFEMVTGFTSVVNMTEEELLLALEDEVLLKQLIQDYWFLSDDILNDELKHALEGFIYPATYAFEVGRVYTIEELVTHLLDVTAQRFEPIKAQLQNSELSINELITLASIVEAETPNIDEMPTVAGVFLNRINIGMGLQSCATIQYILDERVTHVTAEMIAIDSPYNTYSPDVTGLPVGPVGSPSIDAIQAVLTPEENDYFFFIGDVFQCIDGKTHFFETYEEHLAFYDQYLLPSYEAGENVCAE